MILLSIVVLAIGLPLVYEVGLLMEWEYPHWWMLHHVRNARTVGGEPIATALQRHFGAEARSIHWHTCGYCIDRTGRSENLRHVQFEMRGHFFSFAYDIARNQLTPMSELTVKEFPELVPRGDRLVPAPFGGRVDDDSFVLPASWQTR